MKTEKQEFKINDDTENNPIVKKLWDDGKFLHFYKSYDGDIERATLIYENSLIEIEWNCYCNHPFIKEIQPLKVANVEGLIFPIVKTSYKRVIEDLLKRGFIRVENEFISSNVILTYRPPQIKYGFKFPITIKGEIKKI